MQILTRVLAVMVVCSLLGASAAHAQEGRFEAGGYFRVMTRPDFQGGDSKLGFWNLYGRLLNEGPYAALELRLNLLPRKPATTEVWTRIHAKIEGGSIATVDGQGGALSNFRLSQLYVQAGNVLLANVTWQIGTLDTYFGDLGLYDLRLAQVFSDTVGMSARYNAEPFDVVIGVGDAGFALRGLQYSTVLTAGGSARLRLGDHVQVGIGGQVYAEPKVEGNQYAPHDTPGVGYEDFVRGEVVERFLEDNPMLEDFFPRPQATSSSSYRAIAYLGFGGLGPLKWSSLYGNFTRKHPDDFVTETFNGRDYDIYVKSLTDERFQLNVGNEMQLNLVPDRLDVAWAVLYGRHWDDDNDILANDYSRTFYSSVLRVQYYLNSELHILAETSAAREISDNGNLYRDHVDSVFESTAGVSDPRGLEYGDADQRDTWQGKIGWVLNPLGYGIYTRPSLRILYGVQHSTQTNAFGNNFVDSLDDFNVFTSKERHWHQVIALEAEAWF